MSKRLAPAILAAFLWIVDSVQHAAILCEKTDTRDFICTKEPPP
ncbi:MAG: hypothetical protein WA633_20365 [Stellaceae bacterium]